jgi:hypothetical protein
VTSKKKNKTGDEIHTPVLTCHSSLVTALKIVFFVVVVQIGFFDDVQLDRIESDDFQFSPALFARDYIAFVRVRINVDIRFAFRACSGRHLISPFVLMMT